MGPRMARSPGPRIFGAALALAFLMTACAPVLPGNRMLRDLDVAPPFPAFARLPTEAPTISSGTFGWPIMVFDPGVYADAEGYHLFFTTPFCRRDGTRSYSWDPAHPLDCDIIDALGSIAYAFSADRGRTWMFRRTPVVLPPTSGFDSAKIETAHVFRVGDTLYLTYSADGDRGGRKLPSRYQIGIAKLELRGRSVRDALMDPSQRFERRPTPWLSFDLTPGRFDNNVQEPSVVVRDGRIELYYIGLGLSLPEEPIDAPGQAIESVALGRAEYDLGLHLLSRSRAPLTDFVNLTEVRYFDGRYHMFASTLVGGEFHRDEEISYATSSDGLVWSPETVILSLRKRPGWDAWGMMAPTVAVEDDRVVLFYTAYEAARHRCFPVPKNGRFGMPVAGGSKCLFATLGRAVSLRRRLPSVPTSPPP